MQVQALLKKASALDIETICPLHGPVLSENLEYYINLYDIWSSYRNESEGVVIAYSSVYGNTKKAALYLEEKLIENDVKKLFVLTLQEQIWLNVLKMLSVTERLFSLVLHTTEMYSRS